MASNLTYDAGRSRLGRTTMDPFRPFSPTHAAVVCAFLVLVTALITFRRRTSGSAGMLMDRWLGILAAGAFVVTNGWPLLPGNFRLDWSLPLHGCDVSLLFVPIVLLTNWGPARALLYFWGLGLNTQGMITPDLQDGPARVGFWTFWLAHCTIVGGALYDVARGYRPTWRDYRLALVACVAYVAVVLPLDLALGVNYGYIGRGTPGQPTIVDALGPWPWRVGIMFALAAAAMALLMTPWAVDRRLRAVTPRSTPAGSAETTAGRAAGS